MATTLLQPVVRARPILHALRVFSSADPADRTAMPDDARLLWPLASAQGHPVASRFRRENHAADNEGRSETVSCFASPCLPSEQSTFSVTRALLVPAARDYATFYVPKPDEVFGRSPSPLPPFRSNRFLRIVGRRRDGLGVRLPEEDTRPG